MTETTRFENAAADCERTVTALREVLVGQEELVTSMLVSVVAQGHLLIEGVPGLAKTTALRCLSQAVAGEWQRVQFTSDLLPSDLVGTRVWDPARGEFSFVKGPVFANFVLADEVNRAPAKVQSALLEAMEERQVTAGRETWRLPSPFLVLATQNPLDAEGTYVLPESQMDRFLMKVSLSYPSPAQEEEVAVRHLNGTARVRQTLTLERLDELSRLAREVFVPSSAVRAAVSICQATRQPRADIEWGAGPRGTLAMLRVAQAMALLDARPTARLADVVQAARPCLRHRLGLSRRAVLDGVSADTVLGEIVAQVVPDEDLPA